jgi:hypothetical protein
VLVSCKFSSELPCCSAAVTAASSLLYLDCWRITLSGAAVKCPLPYLETKTLLLNEQPPAQYPGREASP